MSRGTILLRVDGTAEEGMGRIARCLALANALQRRRYQMTFLSKIEGGWPDRIRRFRHNIVRTPHAAGSDEDRAATLAMLRERRPAVFVTDAPIVDEEYFGLLSTETPLVICLSETTTGPSTVPLVLNPTLNHSGEDYSPPAGVQLLTGPRYVLVRSEFRRARSVRAVEPGGPLRVMLALGGGEVAEDTARYAEALLKNNSAIERIDAIVGASRPGCRRLSELADEHTERLTVVRDARDLGTRMTKSHLLVAGGGNTALEAACVGMPMILVTRHERHRLNATKLEEIGVAQYLGDCAKVKPRELARVVGEVLEDRFERRTMSRAGRMLIDGRGPDRLVTATEILLRRKQSVAVMAA